MRRSCDSRTLGVPGGPVCTTSGTASGRGLPVGMLRRGAAEPLGAADPPGSGAPSEGPLDPGRVKGVTASTTTDTTRGRLGGELTGGCACRRAGHAEQHHEGRSRGCSAPPAVACDEVHDDPLRRLDPLEPGWCRLREATLEQARELCRRLRRDLQECLAQVLQRRGGLLVAHGHDSRA